LKSRGLLPAQYSSLQSLQAFWYATLCEAADKCTTSSIAI
jgi:hypothetical protein